MTLHEHLEALDQMIVHAAAEPKIRNQISFIQGEIAALEAKHSRLKEAYASLYEQHSKLQQTLAQNNTRVWEQFQKEMNDLYGGDSFSEPEQY